MVVIMASFDGARECLSCGLCFHFVAFLDFFSSLLVC